MQSRILSIFTRSPLHVGAGNSVGAIDSPIMRERHTRIPIIPGSSLKGVIADLWFADLEKNNKGQYLRKEASQAMWLFGSDDPGKASAGALLIGEARVLAFPVRSAKNSFAWITCPLALERFKRDANIEFEVPELDDDMCFASSELSMDGKPNERHVIFEEYSFKVKDESDLFSNFKKLINDDLWQEIGKRFAIVSDGIFSHFCEHACEVVTRVRIDDETGTVAKGALFNQENVPSETMFYSVISAQDKKGDTTKAGESALNELEEKLKKVDNLLQIGGDETIGLGYCSVAFMEGN